MEDDVTCTTCGAQPDYLDYYRQEDWEPCDHCSHVTCADCAHWPGLQRLCPACCPCEDAHDETS